MGHDGRFTLAKQAAVLGAWGKTIILSMLVVVLALAPLAFERRAAVEQPSDGDPPADSDPAPDPSPQTSPDASPTPEPALT